MGKNTDLIQILLIVIIGMFIPFLGSLIIMFDVSPISTEGLLTIGSTFGYFLLIFGIELGIVYVYFYSTNAIAQKKIDNEAKKRKKKE
ncbi:MAG: hypothetical protein KGY50_02475 [Candidatus Thermoplasmatota archaeon]|nr:hypothetical protein [Candidatus Thermoplasmatota archaeon]